MIEPADKYRFYLFDNGHAKRIKEVTYAELLNSDLIQLSCVTYKIIHETLKMSDQRFSIRRGNICYICERGFHYLTNQVNSDRNVLSFCDREGRIPTKDHHIPASKGGKSGDNLFVCCDKCQAFKSDNSPTYPIVCTGWTKAGFTVSKKHKAPHLGTELLSKTLNP